MVCWYLIIFLLYRWKYLDSPFLNFLRITISWKWVFRVKENIDDFVEKYKAGLVPKDGYDFFKTFSLVVKTITIRIFVTLALTHKWPIFQLNVNNAFLSRLTSRRILHVSTLRFEAVGKSLGCRFNKAIYMVSNKLQEFGLKG